MRGDAVVAEVLKREGVEYLFCFPHNPLIDAAAAVGIRPILTRTERTLVNMADGYSRVTNGYISSGQFGNRSGSQPVSKMDEGMPE